MKLRSILKAVLAIACVLLLFALYLRAFGGKVQSKVVSPDGKYVAQSKILDGGGATEAFQVIVQVGSKWNPFKHTVFSASTYGATFKTSWTSSDKLLVQCIDCTQAKILRQEPNWNSISIRYDVQH